jgi:hypothetical protein
MANLIELIASPVKGGSPKKTTYKVGESAKAEGQSIYNMLVDGQPVPKGTKITRKSNHLHFEFPDGTVFDITDWCGVSESKFSELLGSMGYDSAANKFVDIREIDSGACALVADGGAAAGALGAPGGIGALEIAGGIGLLALIAAAGGGGGSSAPAGPTALTGALAAGSAAAAGSNVTKSNTPGISGKGGPGEKITVKLPTGEELTTTVDAQGNWTVTPTKPLADGNIAAIVTATSASGVAGTPTTINFIVDTVAPGAPAIVAIPENTDGYISGAEAGDGTPVRLSLANTGAKAGDTLTLNWGTQKITKVLTAADIAAGTVTVDVPAATVLAQGNGKVVVTANITDAAGNVGVASAAADATVALNAPNGAPDLIAANDSGASDVDNTTNVNRPAFTIAATPAGYTTQLLVDGVVVAATVTTANGVTQLVPTTALTDGPHAISVAFTDAGGVRAPVSPVLNIIIDTVAPTAAPSPITLDPASDTGTSNSDAVTADSTPSYRVPAPRAGEALRMFVDGALVAATYDAASGTLTPVTPLSVGVHQISFATVDTAGNQGPLTAALPLTVVALAAAPAAAPDMTAATDLGFSSTDNITSNNKPSFAVAAPPSGSAVVLLVDGIAVAATYDAAAGTLTPTTALSNGPHTITSAFTNPNGDPGVPSPSLAITINSGPIAAPTSAKIATTSDSGTLGDSRTNDQTPDISGTGIAGQRITVVMPGTGETLTTTVGADGTWTVTPTQPLANGTNANATVTATDVAGNVSPASNVAIIIDTTGPTLTSSSPGDNATNVLTGSTISLTYDEAVALGAAGTITLYNFDTGLPVESFNVANGRGTNGGTLSVAGNVVTLNLGAATVPGTHYDVQTTAGAVRDVAGNNAAALETNTALDFTTFTAPIVNVTNLAKTAYSQFLHTTNPNLVDTNKLGFAPGSTPFGEVVTEFTNKDDVAKVVDITAAFNGGLNWFGTVYNQVGLSTNGYLTFGHTNTSYSPEGIANYTGNSTGGKGGIIAAQYDDWWNGDRNPGLLSSPGGNSTGTNLTYFAAYQNASGGVVTLTYDDVGFWGKRSPGLFDGLTTNDYTTGNAEQIRLIRTSTGETVIQLVYENVSWIAGSPGSGNGQPTAGWSKGDTQTYGLVDGNIAGASSGGISGTNNFLDVESASNVGINGVFEWVIGTDGQVAAGNVPLISTHTALAQESTQLSANTAVTYAQSSTAWDSRFELVGSKIIAKAGINFAVTETSVDLTVVVTDTATGGTINKIVSIQLFDQIGGAGNDQIGIRAASDIAKLTSAVATQVVMNGNGGEDSLVFTGSGLNLDLTTVQDTALINVERINLGSSNSLKLALADVFALSSANQFNSGNGWNGLPGTVTLEQLVIDGNGTDTLTVGSSAQWTQTSAGTVTNGGQTYNIYNSTSGTGQLLVDTDVRVIWG